MAKHNQSASSYDQMYESGGYQGVYELPYRHSSYFPLFKSVLRRLQGAGARSVLEVGCGSGAFAHYLMDSTSMRYHGFDFSAVAVKKAQERTGRADAFHVGDATKAESYPEDYDCVACTEVLEHVPEDLSIPLNWKKGSFCVCSVPNFDADNHERFFRSEGEVMARYGSLIEIRSVSRIKKPPISDISWRSMLQSIWWSRYRPDQLSALIRLTPFDELGGWFLFAGHCK